VDPRVLTTAETLILLSLDEERGALRGGAFLSYGAAAALLVDLILAGRIAVSATAVELIDARPTGHELEDELLARLARGKVRQPDHWITEWGRGLLAGRLLTRLCDTGALRRYDQRVFGFWNARRYRLIPPRLRITIQAELRGVLSSDQAVDAAMSSLVAIIAVVGPHEVLGPKSQRREALARAKALARSDVVSAALQRAIATLAAVQDASSAAIVATF
jgi:hypothetical protein